MKGNGFEKDRPSKNTDKISNQIGSAGERDCSIWEEIADAA